MKNWLWLIWQPPLGIFGAIMDMAMSIPKMMHNEEMQEDTQQYNRAEAIDARDFNSAQAVAQRDWQERMSNTQYQRAASDASAAGLNRILAMRQGANVAGSGSSASGPAASSSSSPASLNSNFAQAMQAESIMDNVQMDTRKKDAERNYTSQLWNTSRAQEALTNQQYETERHRTDQARHTADILSNDAKGRSLEGEIDTTTYGKIMRYIDRSIRSITGGSSAYGRMRE